MSIERTGPAVAVHARRAPVGAVHVVLALRVIRAPERQRDAFVRHAHVVVLQQQIPRAEVDHQATAARDALFLIPPPWVDPGARSELHAASPASARVARRGAGARATR